MYNIICGYLTIRRKKYTFTFDDKSKILLIQPTKLEKYPSFIKEWDFDKHPYLKGNIDVEGYTTNNNYIKFINLNFRSIRWGCFQSFVPAYILGDANLVEPLPKPNNIYKMSFTGKAVDLLINPRKHVKDESNDITNEIALKAYNIKSKEIKKQYMYKNKNLDLYFSPSYKITTAHKDVTRVLDMFSILSIGFNDKIQMNEILDLYVLIEKLLSFTNHRKKVDFDEILLFQKEKIKIGDDIRETTIQFKLIITKNNEEAILPDKVDNTIQIEEIKEHLSTILNNLLEDDFILLPFPLSFKDSHLVNNDKFLEVSASFESEISFIHEDFRAEQEKDYKKAKSIIQSFLNDCIRNKDYNSDTRRTFKYFYDEIDKLDGSLRNKILYYLKKYEDIIKFDVEYLKNVKGLKDIQLETIAESFADKRNNMTHGKKIESYNPLLTVSYSIVMKLCYVLFLQRSGFSDSEIRKITDKIFI